MFLAELNWVAIAAAFVVVVAVGAIWFGPKTFYPKWLALTGLEETPGQGLGNHGTAFVFGFTFLGALVQTVALASVMHFVALANGSPLGPLGGLITGLLLGVGFAAATSLSHRLFAGQGIRVWLIEVGGDIVALTLAGLVLGLFS